MVLQKHSIDNYQSVVNDGIVGVDQERSKLAYQ